MSVSKRAVDRSPKKAADGEDTHHSNPTAEIFHPNNVRPISPGRIQQEDIDAISEILMEPNCTLLAPTMKEQVTDDHIRSMIFIAGGRSAIYARLFLSYLSSMRVDFASLHHLLDALNTLKFESQEYKIDLYLYFNQDLTPPEDAPPQINHQDIEVLFVEGGGFLTLSILQYLSSLSSTFQSFEHLKSSLHEQVEAHLVKLDGYKSNLIRFLTCANINEFTLDSTVEQHTPTLTPPLPSPMLDYKVTIDTIRHLLFIGATDVQLIYLLTRIYNSLKGRKIKDERRLISLVKKEWNSYLLDVSTTLDWLVNPSKNFLFVESLVSVLSTGATGPAQSKVTTTIHVPHASFDGATVEKLFLQGGLGHVTLTVLKNLNAKKVKFRSMEELITALRNQGEAIEAMTTIHTYLNSFHCALWPISHAPRAEVTESQINSLLTSLPEGSTIPLVLKECRRYERIGHAYREKHSIGRDGIIRKPAVPLLARKPTATELSMKKEEYLQEDIPHQFTDWPQLASTLSATIPAALAQLVLDREHLSLTLADANLFLSRSLDSPDALPGQQPKLAYSNRDLDSLLSIVYENEERRLNGADAVSGVRVSPFTLLDLLALFRKWHLSRRKFLHFAALKRGVLQEIGITAGSKSNTEPASTAPTPKIGPTNGTLALNAGTLEPPTNNATETTTPTDTTDTPAPTSASPPPPTTPANHERELLATFLNAADRHLLLPLPDESYHLFSDVEIDQLLEEKNSLAPASGLTGLTVGAPVPTKSKDVTLNGIQLFIAALRYIEAHAPPAPNARSGYGALAASGGFATLSDLLSSIRDHYRQLSAQMSDCLKYLKTSRRLFQDSGIAITWTLAREVLTLYTDSGADLMTLALVRKLERDRYQEAPYQSLQDLVAGLQQALIDLTRTAKVGITDSDRARLLTALVQASQIPEPANNNLVDHQPLMPLSLLDPAAAESQLNQLLSEYTLFTSLQHIAILTHNLTMKMSDAQSGKKVSGSPQSSPKLKAVEPAAAASIPTRPAYATWHALNLAIHESVLDFNRIRTEVFTLLSSPTCTLLSLSKPSLPITYESVDRLVKACGLLDSDLLAVLNHLQDRGVRVRTLVELATRAKNFYLERRKAEQQAARYGFMKNEIVAYLASPACQLFLNAAARARVQSDLDDTATFVQFMQASGGTLKSSLSLIHALESDELAFDSLDGIIDGIETYQARELLKRKFLPFINNANVCHLFDKPGSKFKEVRPDDPALAQLLDIDLSEAAIEELTKAKPNATAPASSPPAAPETEPIDLESPTASIELILDFVYRMNSSSTRRFGTFQELVNVVQKELEKSTNAANPLVPQTPHQPRRYMDSGFESDRSGTSTNRNGDQHQVGYESDDDVDVRDVVRPSVLAVPPSPSAAVGPAGLSRKGSLAMRPSRPLHQSSPSLNALLLSSFTPHDAPTGEDIEETPEEAAAEEARRKARQLDKVRKEVEALQQHGWILKEDEEWMIIDRQNVEEAEMTEELLNDRRLAIFSALSYPQCLLFSNRVEPMSLSDIDLDAVLASAGGGEKGLRIAIAIIKLLDRKHAKYFWFDQVTLEISRRWQRRKAWEYLTLDPAGKTMLDHSSSIPLFVLRLLAGINKSHGVDPALSALDMLQLAHEIHPEPFQTHAELIHTVKELVKTERRETLKAAIQTQFIDMFPRMPKLTDAKMDLLLGGVDDSLYHALKYLELVQAEGGRDFTDILDLVPIITSLHLREKSGVPASSFDDFDDDDDDDAFDDLVEDAAAVGDDQLMLRRQKIFQSLSFPKCTLFTTKNEPFTLTDIDLDDVVKAANNRLTYALKCISVMDKREGLKFKSFYSALLELTQRCQAHYTMSFLLSHDNHLLHSSVSLPRDRSDPALVELVRRLLTDGMTAPDPYLTIIACLKALNQVPKILAQSPPHGGYRTVEEFIAALKSLADEQRVWMVKSYFAQPALSIVVTDPETGAKSKPPPITDLQVATLLHSCANSIFFVLRHLQSLELGVSGVPTVYGSYDAVLADVARAHLKLLELDPALAGAYTPSSQPVAFIPKPNEAKQMLLQEQRALAAAQGVTLDRETRTAILLGDDPHAAQVKAAAHALIEYERIESEVLTRTLESAEAKVLTSDRRFLVDARFQLLNALSYPNSNLFSKCIRTVSIGDEQLDDIFRCTFAHLTDDAASAALADECDEDATLVWRPTATQLQESIRIVKLFDSQGMRFPTFARFLHEYRAHMLEMKRQVLLTHLFYPKSQLFTNCTQSIEITTRELDQLLTIPKPTLPDGRGNHPNGSSVIALSHILATLDHLNQEEMKVYSFVELVELIKNILTQVG